MPDSSYTGALERGAMLPSFSLPGTDNLPHGPWDYKQREHLVLLLLPSSQEATSRTLLKTYADRYKDFREERCALLAITADPVIRNITSQEELHLPYPLLADPQGSVIARYTHWEPETRSVQTSIVLADRYSAVYQHWQASSEEVLPTIEELLESLQYLNRLCTP